ncbi:hypothetical protein DFH08DRAFT_796638 [Mycena albidolilacea]|uniref:Uncharacterized protein n=1 Tax=Mycena albidolilacea TaxID=1033008 RepID=A0AAD7AVV7_9AGAR|nr:hypothetical protein DFH08DRAFT_796638 [Mycena albidolilacea]
MPLIRDTRDSSSSRLSYTDNRRDCRRAVVDVMTQASTTANSSTIDVEAERAIHRNSNLGRKSRRPVSAANTGFVSMIRGAIWSFRRITEGVAFKHSIKASTVAGRRDNVKAQRWKEDCDTNDRNGDISVTLLLSAQSSKPRTRIFKTGAFKYSRRIGIRKIRDIAKKFEAGLNLYAPSAESGQQKRERIAPCSRNPQTAKFNVRRSRLRVGSVQKVTMEIEGTPELGRCEGKAPPLSTHCAKNKGGIVGFGGD